MSGGGQPALESAASNLRQGGEGPLSEPQRDPLIGKVLGGRFEIVAPIGAGGMARVYRAIQRPLDRPVALKVLHPLFDTSLDPEFEKRFLLEAAMTAKVKHPNIVTVHDYGRSEDGTYFIAMELVEGETLHRLLKRTGPLPWPRAFSLGAQVARSLRQAHQLGLVHRDLKPANIMVLPDGEAVKVLDFGLVKNVGLAFADTPGATAITQASRVLGSPLYMAPEQVRNKADARSDIYSLGIVLYQAIAGRTPFVGEDLADILVRHLREKPPELRALAPVPAQVNGLVMRCLEKEPGARFQSMDELLEGMRDAAENRGEPNVTGVLHPSANTALSPARAASEPCAAAHWRSEAPAHEDAGDDLSISISVELPLAAPRDRRWMAGFGAGLGLAAIAGALLVCAGAVRELGSPKPAMEPAPAPRPERVASLPVAELRPAPAREAAAPQLASAPEPPAPKAARVPAPLPAPKAALLPTPPPAPSPATRAIAAATPVPVDVVFEITSEPSGAALSLNGSPIGRTPFTLIAPREGKDPVGIDLEFSLDGYQTAAVSAQALAGTLPLHQVLTKVPAQPTPAPDGYKADPYDEEPPPNRP